jgi:hypothetical protein
MNTMKTCIIALIALIGTITLKAQTADDIIAKHVFDVDDPERQ